MWNLVYKEGNMQNPTFTNLKVTNLTETEKLNKLSLHIKKYQTNFKFTDSNLFDNRLRFLIKWTNDNYLKERIQTLKTLYEQCEKFVSSDQFMTFVSNYFTNDPLYMRLVDRNITLNDLIKVLEAYPRETLTRISRLLESYDRITFLNYVSGVTRLRLNDFENSDGRIRLMLALEDIADFSKEYRLELFENTYQFFNEEQAEIFIECWLKTIKQDVKQILEKTNSTVCKNYMILNLTNEINKIGEILNDKL